jgi:hypothetical protein
VAFSKGVKAPGLDICCGVDRPSTCETESYMEKLAFTRVCLSDVKVIMTIYVCILGRIATLADHGMDSCTRVPVARHAWGL